MSALDLAKVGLAFGFSTPPSVNINIGAGLKGKKRKSDGKGGSEDDDDDESSGDEAEAMTGRRAKAAMLRKGGSGIEKRREVGGAKQGQKDHYRAKKDGAADGKQWSR